MSNRDRDLAVEILHHYISLVMRAAGLQPDRDTLAEVEVIVDRIIKAAQEKP